MMIAFSRLADCLPRLCIIGAAVAISLTHSVAVRAQNVSVPYMIRNRSDDSNKCLIFGGNGQEKYPSRYDWGAGNEFCGFPGGKEALLNNKQAVFDLVPIQDAPILTSQKDLARKYAPVIWLAQGEEWLPSSIDFYAANMMAVCDGRTITDNILALKTEMLPPGRGAPDGGPSSRCYFVTRQALSGPYDRPAFFHGQNPAQTSVPIYVFLYPDEQYNDSGSFYGSIHDILSL